MRKDKRFHRPQLIASLVITGAGAVWLLGFGGMSGVREHRELKRLADLIRNHPKVDQEAAAELFRHGERSRAWFRDLLEDPDPRVRRIGLNFFAMADHEGIAFHDLMYHHINDSDPVVRASAQRACASLAGLIGKERYGAERWARVREACIAEWLRGNPEFRCSTAANLGWFGAEASAAADELLRFVTDPAIADEALPDPAAADPGRDRSGAYKALVSIDPLKATEAGLRLIAWIESPNERLSGHAWRCLRSPGNRLPLAVRERLAKLLATPSFEDRMKVAELLAFGDDRPGDAARDAYTEIIADARAALDVRRRSLEPFRFKGKPPSARLGPALDRQLQENDPKVRFNALLLLGDMPYLIKDRKASLVKAVDDPMPGIRALALDLLGRYEYFDETFFALCIKLLREPDPGIRNSALRSLSLAGDRALAALPELTALVDDPALDPELRSSIALIIEPLRPRKADRGALRSSSRPTPGFHPHPMREPAKLAPPAGEFPHERAPR